MIDLTNAKLPPYQAFHDFHERLNIYIKVASASATLLVQRTGDISSTDELGKLIAVSHPSWKTPPVRGLTLNLQRDHEAGISSFALVAIFSAFDDFLGQIEGSFSAAGITAKRIEESAEKERVFKLYEAYGWSKSDISSLETPINYFRLIRNCIAHRKGLASPALANLSIASVEEELDIFQESTRSEKTKLKHIEKRQTLPPFSVNQQIILSPIAVILCSHILRQLTKDANSKLVEVLGSTGVMRLLLRKSARDYGANFRMDRPQVAMCRALDAHGIKFDLSGSVVAEMKRENIWDNYLTLLLDARKNKVKKS